MKQPINTRLYSTLNYSFSYLHAIEIGSQKWRTSKFLKSCQLAEISEDWSISTRYMQLDKVFIYPQLFLRGVGNQNKRTE